LLTKVAQELLSKEVLEEEEFQKLISEEKA